MLPAPRSLLLALSTFLFTGCANRIFYQPSRQMHAPPSSRDIAFEPMIFETEDGLKLTGWWLPGREPVKGTVVHFHGNAHNMSSHVQFVEWLPAEGYHVVVFDYRGYGRSQGSPSRNGVVKDGVAALETVANHPDFTPPLLVWGQSLGGTVALRSILASSAEVELALIDSTFTGYGDIAADKMRQFPWWLQPLRLIRPVFVTNGPDAEDAVRELQDLPMAFLHGEQDQVIPVHHTRTLHELAPEGTPLLIVPNARHCDAVLRFPEQVRPWILDIFNNH